MRIIVVHGTMGTPDGNWFPWLRNWAQERSVVCVSPRFPTPRGQSLEEWHETLRKTIGEVREDDVLIGFSIGASFVCRVLEQATTSVHAALLISPFVRQLGSKQFDPYNDSFVREPFDWSLIRSKAKRFYTYAGSNDPYVPLMFAREVSGALCVDLQVVDGGGHLNAESGFTTAPFLEGALARELMNK